MNFFNHKSRREFLIETGRGGAALVLGAGLAGGLLPRLAQAGQTQQEDARFFLHISFPGGTGADPNLTFDARPLSMTAAGLVTNYLGSSAQGEEPELWTGTNGQTAWGTSIVSPLKPFFKDSLSIINGVHMATSFDGHDQNTNFFLTGNPFGGESFLPHLNEQGVRTPLDAIQQGRVPAQTTNTQNVVPTSPDGAYRLVQRIRRLPAPLDPMSSLFKFLESRMAHAAGVSQGRFSLGASKMQSGLSATPDLAARLGRLELSAGGQGLDDQTRFVELMSQAFKTGVCRTAMLVIPLAEGDTLDTHDSTSARRSPQVMARWISRLTQVLTLLKTTRFDERRSLMDVTTFTVTSEFGRTMRQDGNPIDLTGTDHNPLSNTVLIGGRGIRAGQIIGESDFRAVGETLSPAHLAIDSRKIKIMGRAMDFATLRPRADLPATFKTEDYLNCASVLNTVYECMGAAPMRYRTLGRNLPVAPGLKGLLT